jgi:AmpE protein
MELIAILISLVVERFLGSMEEFRNFSWFRRYAGWLVQRLSAMQAANGPLGVLFILLLPVLLTLTAEYYLTHWWVVFGLAFSVVILLFSFGPHDLEAQVEAYVEAEERDDQESAKEHAAVLLGQEASDNEADLTREIIQTSLVEANERIFAVLIWFLVLGPTGAILYRLTSQLAHHSWGEEQAGLAEAVQRLHAILDWPTSRLCALAFAFAGSFVDALHAWRIQERQDDWEQGSHLVLIATGLGALGYVPGEEEDGHEHDISLIHETLALIRRAVVVFLGIAALFTLAGWMS